MLLHSSDPFSIFALEGAGPRDYTEAVMHGHGLQLSSSLILGGAKFPKGGYLGVPYILRIFGTGTPHILGYFARGCQKLGVTNIL